MPTVFISYNHQDEPTAARLTDDLRAAGIDVWFAKEEITVGQLIPEEIENALRSSDYLVALLSHAAINSRWVKEELSAAKTIEIQRKGVFILPVLLDDCDIPPLLRAKRCADLRTSYERGLKDILEVFKRTVALGNEVERYRELEARWTHFLASVESETNALLKLARGSQEKLLSLSEEYRVLGERIRNGLDVYRALRPLERSARLGKLLDERALVLGAVAGAEDVRLQILKAQDPRMTPVTTSQILDLGTTQAMNGLDNEGSWTFRVAVRLAIGDSDDWTSPLFAVTYRLSRVIAWLHLDERVDGAIARTVCETGDYLRTRCARTLTCFRRAVEEEVPLHLKNLNDRVSYGNLMEAVGFWREAIGYLRDGRDALVIGARAAERVLEIERVLDTLESRKAAIKLTVQPIRCLPPLLTEFGTRQRMDKVIAEIETDFWEEVVALDPPIAPEDYNRLVP